MKYRLTPLNIFCAFLTAVEIDFFAFPEMLKNETYGYQHYILIPVILVGLLIDWVFQKLIAKYLWLALVELVLLVAFVMANIRLG